MAIFTFQDGTRHHARFRQLAPLLGGLLLAGCQVDHGHLPSASPGGDGPPVDAGVYPDSDDDDAAGPDASSDLRPADLGQEIASPETARADASKPEAARPDGTADQPPPADIAPGPVDCQVSAWGSFSTCSQPCGGGSQARTRTVLTPASGGGAPCPVLTETQTCNPQACPVDCQLSTFGPWSACSKECGTGSQTRTRTVVVPPSGGGAACGELMQTQACNTMPVNACGGCAKLNPAPPAACGVCGKTVCAGPNQTTCNDSGPTCQSLGATCGAPPNGCGGQLACGGCADALTSCSPSFACACGKPTNLNSPEGGLETGKKAPSPDGRFVASADGLHDASGQLLMAFISPKGFDWHPSRPGRFALMRHFNPPEPLSIIEIYDVAATGQVVRAGAVESNQQWHHYLAWQNASTIALGSESECRTVTTVQPQTP